MKSETLQKIVEDQEQQIDTLKQELADLKEAMREAETVPEPETPKPTNDATAAPTPKNKSWLE